MKNSRLLVVALGSLLMTSSARGQVIIEISKITCEQFLGFKLADPKDIAIWLSGYYYAKRGSTSFEPQTLRTNFEKLKSACFARENLKSAVMQVMEKGLADSK